MKLSELFNNDGLMPKRFKDIVQREVDLFGKQVSITDWNSVPPTHNIRIENPLEWAKVKDVICVFVDMKGSTQLSAIHHAHGTASIYRLFTQTAVSMFDEFEAAYIDVKGDGAFALFDADKVHRALAAAVTFKTFAANEFVKRVKEKTKLDVGYHIGIDQETLLVRKLGFKMVGRTDRQNEVWAGKTVNMAAKLASAANSELLVSDRFYGRLTSSCATHSCGCNGGRQPLWKVVDVSADSRFDFDTAYRLDSQWCKVHGNEYCNELLRADQQSG